MDQQEPHSWIIFHPKEGAKGAEITEIAQQVRLNYRAIQLAGLKSPEFDPADYFGYMFPTKISMKDADNGDKDLIVDVFAFGLMHIDHADVVKNAPREVNVDELREKSIRMFCFEIVSFLKADFKFPCYMHYHKYWDGLNGWLSGKGTFKSEMGFMRLVLTYLITPPAITEDQAAGAASDLIKRIQGGN